MIPIQETVGHRIACPMHAGETATVAHARGPTRGGGAPSVPSVASLWYVVECPMFGKKLYKAGTLVELAEGEA
jgi:hypothetical protein